MKKSSFVSLGIALAFSLNGAFAQPNASLDVQKLAGEVNKRALSREEAQQLQLYIETHPGDIRARKTLGRVYETYGFYILALEEYGIASSIAKSDPEALLLSAKLQYGLNVLDPDRVADHALKYMANDLPALVQVGVCLYNLGKVAQGDRLYEKAVQLHQNTPEFSCIQAYALLVHGRYAECLAQCDQAMKAQNLQCLVLLAKGQALRALNKPQQALEAFRQAQTLEPMNVDVNEHYFRALLARGKNTEALEPGLLALAMTLHERNQRSQRDLLQLLKHTPPASLRKAIAEASRKLEVTPFQVKFHFELGNLFDKLNQPDLAIKEYQRGLQLNPVFAPAYVRLAKDFSEYRRDYNQALQNYALALRLDPDDKDLYLRALRLKAIKQNKNDVSMQLKDWWRRSVRNHSAQDQ